MNQPLPPPPRVSDPSAESDLACHPMSGCITCSDEGIPMRLSVAPADGLATCIDEQGNASVVMTGLVEPVGRGEWVLVHAGTALIKIAGPASVNPGGNA